MRKTTTLRAAAQVAASQHTRLTRENFLLVSQEGKVLLNNAALNKGSAFTSHERRQFKLEHLLPKGVNTLKEQVSRAYEQYKMYPTDLLKNSFMESMKVQNEVLYFALVEAHLKEMMGIIYTPTQGDAIANYSHLFRRPSGCFLDIHRQERIDSELASFGGSEDIDYIVVTDSEGILGIGDQGVGGIGISEAKLALMTACGGVHPNRVIPVVLDVGTNNENLLKDPLYMGNRHNRIRGEEYDKFVDNFVQAVKRRFPDAVLHFEDFGTSNASRILERYLPELSCFNDDIQGTGAVTMAALKGALAANKIELTDARILIYGGGSAGIGIAHQILDNLSTTTDLSTDNAKKNLFVVDRYGLITDELAQDKDKVSESQAFFANGNVKQQGTDLKAIVNAVKPNVLIGCSTQPGAFTKEVVLDMASHVDRPIILPLSNPTRLHEAVPKDLIEWTGGNVLVATGSPFKPVNGREIAENNNCFIFPGIGLGAVLSRARRISKTMIAAAVDRLAELAPIHSDPENGALLPDIADIRRISADVATAVVLQAKSEGVSLIEEEISAYGEKIIIPTEYDECREWVLSQMWEPEYRVLIPTQRYTRSHY